MINWDISLVIYGVSQTWKRTAWYYDLRVILIISTCPLLLLLLVCIISRILLEPLLHINYWCANHTTHILWAPTTIIALIRRWKTHIVLISMVCLRSAFGTMFVSLGWFGTATFWWTFFLHSGSPASRHHLRVTIGIFTFVGVKVVLRNPSCFLIVFESFDCSHISADCW